MLIPDFENCNSENCAYPKLQKWFNDNLISKKELLKNETWNMGDIETMYKDSDELLSGFYAYFDNGHRLYNKNINSRVATLLSKGKSFESYIGLLTVDEVVFAGMSGVNNNIYLILNNTSSRFYTMLLSPVGMYSDKISVGMYELDGETNRFRIGNFSDSTYNFSLRPSIVLKSKIKITGGDGSKDNAYTIE